MSLLKLNGSGKTAKRLNNFCKPPLNHPFKAFRFSFVSKWKIASQDKASKKRSQWLRCFLRGRLLRGKRLRRRARNDTVSEHSQRSISQ